MKKGILKVFTAVLSAAFFLTGCATVSNVKRADGKDVYFDTIQYNYGQVVKVEDYVYFANGYTSSGDSGFNYNNARKTGYLSRIDTSKAFTFDEKVEEDRKMYTSPNGVQKVLGDKLVGYQMQDMFALGSYIYFSSPNTHKTSSMENDYDRVSLFRVRFNGDDFSELAKDTAFNVKDGGLITVTQASDNNYYYVIVESAEESKFTIKTMKIGDSLGKLKTVVEDATSYAVADNDSTVKNIIYTVESESEIATTQIKAVDIASGDIEDLDSGLTGSTAKMLGRSGDVVFYSYSHKATGEEVYYKNIAGGSNFNPNPSQRFYSAKSLSEVQKAGEGYIFKASESGSLLYKTLEDSEPSLLLTKDDFTDILFVENDYVYISTSSSIKRISVIDKMVETLVTTTDSNLISGQCGYDGEYLYFFSKTVAPEASEGSDEEETKDENFYMFRSDKQGNIQIIGKTAK